jgi:hypothetical protein
MGQIKNGQFAVFHSLAGILQAKNKPKNKHPLIVYKNADICGEKMGGFYCFCLKPFMQHCCYFFAALLLFCRPKISRKTNTP